MKYSRLANIDYIDSGLMRYDIGLLIGRTELNVRWVAWCALQSVGESHIVPTDFSIAYRTGNVTDCALAGADERC